MDHPTFKNKTINNIYLTKSLEPQMTIYSYIKTTNDNI